MLARHKLDNLLDRFAEIEHTMSANPDPAAYVKLSREYAGLEPLVFKIRALIKAEDELSDAEALMSDPETDAEMRELAELECSELSATVETLTQDVRIGLLPKDEADTNDAILEVRAGTGGDEAALFAGDLFRMYQRFAELQGWKVEVLSASDGEVGGYKEIIASVSGDSVFAKLKFESGVHRVQRVPATGLVAGSIHRRQPSPCCHRRRMSTSTFRTAICGLIPSGPRAQVDSTSTPRILQCVSHICRLVSSWPCKMSALSTRTRLGRCSCSGLAYMMKSGNGLPANVLRLAVFRSGPATARSEFGLTTIPRGVSPITASA